MVSLTCALLRPYACGGEGWGCGGGVGLARWLWAGHACSTRLLAASWNSFSRHGGAAHTASFSLTGPLLTRGLLQRQGHAASTNAKGGKGWGKSTLQPSTRTTNNARHASNCARSYSHYNAVWSKQSTLNTRVTSLTSHANKINWCWPC